MRCKACDKELWKIEMHDSGAFEDLCEDCLLIVAEMLIELEEEDDVQD